MSLRKVSQKLLLKLTNSLVKDDYFSDSDIVVNKFTTDENGRVEITQDYLKPHVMPYSK